MKLLWDVQEAEKELKRFPFKVKLNTSEANLRYGPAHNQFQPKEGDSGIVIGIAKTSYLQKFGIYYSVLWDIYPSPRELFNIDIEQYMRVYNSISNEL